jgi:hypothetical protein
VNRAIALGVIAVLGCGQKKEEKVAAPAKTEPAQPTPVAPAPPVPTPDPWLDRRPAEPAATPPPVAAPPQVGFDTDKLKVPAAGTPVEALLQDVHTVMRATAPELVLTKIVGSYLRKDGALDPTYGRLELELHVLDSVDGVIDDPNRPTGAPVPDVEPAEKPRDRCPKLTFGGGGWISEDRSCTKMKQLAGGPRCSVAQIWTKAIAQGAPDNAVAILQFDARGGSWTFRITDKLRGVSFYRSYTDDCTTATVPPPPPRKGAKANPYAQPF